MNSSGIAKVRTRLRDNGATIRLSLSYLAIIMVLSIGFSVVFYRTSWHELGRQLPPPGVNEPVEGAGDFDYDNFLRNRVDEGRNDLLTKLILLNMGTFVLGGMLSFALARRTLGPIERALYAQSRFASDASHELRTPLAVMQAENEVALRKSGLTLVRAKGLLQSNLEEVTRLKDLADGLLRLAREDQKDIILHPVSLQDCAAEAMNRVVKPAQAKNITVQDASLDINVLTNSNHLVQTLVIFLDNAIKYSDKRATVHIEGSAKGKYGYISVRDEGPGIAAEDLPYIFDRFYRVDPSRAKHAGEGHGLGLSIAQRLAEQMGGDISVRSKLDEGSTFTIKLPLA
jgi:signal transduction histidine kinase